VASEAGRAMQIRLNWWARITLDVQNRPWDFALKGCDAFGTVTLFIGREDKKPLLEMNLVQTQLEELALWLFRSSAQINLLNADSARDILARFSSGGKETQ
jgi:hypothetical protein